jgi:hypothetical protein
MTRRTVVWVTDAESELTELWLLSKSRNQISVASQSIDATLGAHAESVGVVLSEGMKALDEPPLRVLFEILDEDRMVRILKVKLTT